MCRKVLSQNLLCLITKLFREMMELIEPITIDLGMYDQKETQTENAPRSTHLEISIFVGYIYIYI